MPIIQSAPISQTFQTGIAVNLLFGAQFMTNMPVGLVVKHDLTKAKKKEIVTFVQRGVVPTLSDCEVTPTGKTTTVLSTVEARRYANYEPLDFCEFKDTPIWDEMLAFSANPSYNLQFVNTQLYTGFMQGFMAQYSIELNAVRWFGDTQLAANPSFSHFLTQDGYYTQAVNNPNTRKVATTSLATALTNGQALALLTNLNRARTVQNRQKRCVLIIGRYLAEKLWDDYVTANQAALGVQQAYSNELVQGLGRRFFGMDLYVDELWDIDYLRSISATAVSADDYGNWDAIATGKFPKLAMIAPMAEGENHAIHELDAIAPDTLAMYSELFAQKTNGVRKDTLDIYLAAQFGGEIIRPTDICVAVMA